MAEQAYSGNEEARTSIQEPRNGLYSMALRGVWQSPAPEMKKVIDYLAMPLLITWAGR